MLVRSDPHVDTQTHISYRILTVTHAVRLRLSSPPLILSDHPKLLTDISHHTRLHSYTPTSCLGCLNPRCAC